jgi:aminomethyltransferase
LNDFWPVRSPGGDRIGRVTAGAWSPRLERNIGYAWVPASMIDAGTRLEIESPGAIRAASVSALPFVDPAKEIPKS